QCREFCAYSEWCIFSVFCDFCKQLKAQSANISATKQFSAHKSIGDDCKCDEMLPGLYDIETEMCTPEIEDVKDYIPPEIQANILDKKPISMFITVYLMDLEPRNESYLSAFGRAILQRRMAQAQLHASFLELMSKLLYLNTTKSRASYMSANIHMCSISFRTLMIRLLISSGVVCVIKSFNVVVGYLLAMYYVLDDIFYVIYYYSYISTESRSHNSFSFNLYQ
ncbi:hypothetical protein OSTOST_19464, partial [Ostertagia ostertagi]